MNSLQNKLTINFDPHHVCNYRCSYCFLPNKEKDDYLPFNSYFPVAAWIKAISKIKKNIHFSISGLGEPTLLNDFYGLIEGISELDNVLSVAIYSNMSFGNLFEPFST